MKILVLLVALCGSVLGGPQVPHPRGSSGADSGDSSDNAHAPRIAQSLSNIYNILGDRAKGLSKCQFPFTYMGQTYHECTTDHDYYGMYWCSTRTDSEGNHAYNEWRHCQESDGLEGVNEIPPTLCEDIEGTCQENSQDCDGIKRHGLCGDDIPQVCCIGRPKGCVLDGRIYQSGDYNEGTCMKMICINGDWVYKGDIRDECKTNPGGECTVDGDPYVYMFDSTTFLQSVPLPTNRYKFRGTGSYVIAQNGTFGVQADFKTCNTNPRRHGGPGNTCTASVRYFEQGMPIDLVLPFVNMDTFPGYCSNPRAVKEQKCQIKVFVNGTEIFFTDKPQPVQATFGEILIFKHNHNKDVDNLLCANVVGSQGLSVSACLRNDNYAFLYVRAMPTLKKDPKSKLYGLCNTYTGLPQDAFTTDTGAMTTNVTIFGNSWKMTCGKEEGTCQSSSRRCDGVLRSGLGCASGTVCCIPHKEPTGDLDTNNRFGSSAGGEAFSLCVETNGKCQGTSDPCSNGFIRQGLCSDDQQVCCIQRPLGCVLDGKSYQSGDYNEGSCLKMICINGDWEFTGEPIRPECGDCNVAGDPHLWVFDKTKGLPHDYLLGGKGNFVITQNTLKTPTFGVTADFKTCNGQNRQNLTCIHSVKYYEQGNTIELVLPKQDISHTFPPFCSNPSAVEEPECQIKVKVNEGTERMLGKSVEHIQATFGQVLVFKHNHIKDEKDLLCVNVVGTQGISVSLCERQHNFAYLYVLPMETLKKHPRSELYGLCNTYTGMEQNAFTTHSGAMTDNIAIFSGSWECSKTGSCP